MTKPTKLAVASGRVRCHACRGWFSLAFENGDEQNGRPTALHSLPYCKAFERIETVLDAVAFSEKCRQAGSPS